MESCRLPAGSEQSSLLATASVSAYSTIAASEETAEVLLEADPGFLRDPCRVGIQGAEKILDLLLSLLIARWRGLPWLDCVLHFLLHP